MGYSECLSCDRNSSGFAFLINSNWDIRVLLIQSLQLFSCLFAFVEDRTCDVYQSLLLYDIEFDSKHIRLRLIVWGLSNGKLLFFCEGSLDNIWFNGKRVAIQWMKAFNSERTITGYDSLLYQIIWSRNNISRLYWNTIKIGNWSICAKWSPLANYLES